MMPGLPAGIPIANPLASDGNVLIVNPPMRDVARFAWKTVGHGAGPLSKAVEDALVAAGFSAGQVISDDGVVIRSNGPPTEIKKLLDSAFSGVEFTDDKVLVATKSMAKKNPPHQHELEAVGTANPGGKTVFKCPLCKRTFTEAGI